MRRSHKNTSLGGKVLPKRDVGRRLAAGVAGFALIVGVSFVQAGGVASAAPLADASSVVATFTSDDVDAAKPSGNSFSYTLNMQCASTGGGTCDIDEVRIPLEAVYQTSNEALLADAKAITTWDWQGTSSPADRVSSKVDGTDLVITPTGSNSTLNPGQSLNLTITATPPAGYVPDGTSWTVAPVVSLDNGTRSVTPTGITSSVTASQDVTAFDPSINSQAGDVTAFTGSQITVRFIFPRMTTTIGSVNIANEGFTLTGYLPQYCTPVGDIPFDGAYDKANNTVTWTKWSPTADKAALVSCQFSTDTPLGTYPTHLEFDGYLIGDETPIHAASAVQNVTVVEPTLPTGSFFIKSVYANVLASDADGFTEPRTELGRFVMTESVTDYPGSALISVKKGTLPIDFTAVDNIPCLDAETAGPSDVSVYNSLDRGQLCANPAWKVNGLYVKTMSDGITASVIYADGSSQAVALSPAQTVIDIAPTNGDGFPVAAVQFTGANVPAGSGDAMAVYLLGTFPDVLNPNDQVKNTLWGQVGYSGQGAMSDWASTSPFWVVGTAPYWANQTGTSATITLNSTVVGTAAATRHDANFFAYDKDILAKRVVATVYPDAIAPYVSPQMGIGSARVTNTTTPNFDGQGNTVRRVGATDPGFYWQTVSATSRPGIPVGVYDITTYVGFDGETFPLCMNSGGTNPTTPIVDTTGILGTPGVPTSLCAITDRLIVTGAGSSFDVKKYVQGDQDSEFASYPGTPNVTADGSGQATFRLEVTNTGANAISALRLYDVFPHEGDNLGSAFTPTLSAVPKAKANWTYQYATGPLTCTSQDFWETPTECHQATTWSPSAPEDLSSVTAMLMTYSGPALASGATQTIDLPFTVPAFDAASDVAWNQFAATAVASGPAVDPMLSSKVGVGRVDAQPEQPELKIDKTTSTTSVNPGDEVTFTITVENTGDVAATNVVVDDLADAGFEDLTFTNVTPGTSVSQDGKSWTIARLNTGAHLTAKVTATVAPSATR